MFQRTLDERRRAEQARLERDAFAGEAAAHFVQRALDAGGDIKRVRSERAMHRHDDAVGAVDLRVAELRLRAFAHIGHVAQLEREAVLPFHERLSELRGRERLPFGAEHDALVGVLDEARAADGGRFARGGDHVVEREIEGEQALGLHLDLELAHFTAEDVHLRDAGHGEQTRAQRPVGEGAEFHRRACLRSEAEDERETRAGGERPHLRGFDAGGQLRGGFVEAFAGHLAHAVDVRAVVEGQRDGAEALDGFAADGSELRRAVERSFQRTGDECFDLFWREAGRFGLHDDHRRRELGEDVELGARGHERAVSDDEARQGDDDATELEGMGDEPVQHRISLSSGCCP